MRIGIGYDVHRLQAGRPLIIGGVRIDHPYGLLGHSDADVLIHAVCDALLGAAGLGDIGRHFPDTDPKYKGISSLILLEEVGEKLDHSGYIIANIDAVVTAQKPRLAPYIKEMIQKISSRLDLDPGQVNIKATTTEGLGFEGEEMGISAQAAALIKMTGREH